MNLDVILVASIAATPSTLAAFFSRRANNSVGDKNGSTLHEALHKIEEALLRIEEFEGYQHMRNHDILNTLQASVLQAHEVLRGIDRLNDKLD